MMECGVRKHAESGKIQLIFMASNTYMDSDPTLGTTLHIFPQMKNMFSPLHFPRCEVLRAGSGPNKRVNTELATFRISKAKQKQF